MSIGLPRNDPARFTKEAWNGHVKRTLTRRSNLASQSWPEFFRSIALQMGVVVAIALVITVIFWLTGR